MELRGLKKLTKSDDNNMFHLFGRWKLNIYNECTGLILLFLKIAGTASGAIDEFRSKHSN